MEWLLFFAYLILFFALIYKLKFFSSAGSFSFLAGAFSIKVICGIAAAWIYRNYYDGGDTFVYMNDAAVLYASVKDSPMAFLQLITGINDTAPELQTYYEALKGDSGIGYTQVFNNYLLYVRIMAVICLFSFGMYHVQMLIIVFLSLTGLTALYKLFRGKTSNPATVISIFLIPSVLFWGSALLKEPFVIFLTGMSFYLLDAAIKNRSPVTLSFALCLLLFLTGLKYFIVLALLPGMIAWYIYGIKKKDFLIGIAAAYSTAFILTIIMRLLHERLDIYALLHHQQIIFMKNAVYYKAGSLMELIPFAPNPSSVIKRFPEAIATALFRPYLWESKGIIQYAAAAENILLLLFLLFNLYHFKIKLLRAQPYSLVAIAGGMIILAITAFTTPVIGALVRLKVPGILLLFAGLSSCTEMKIKGKKEKAKVL